MNRFTVFFDANVFVPAQLRSFLMYVTLEDMFRPRWTYMIHREWVRAVHRNRPDIAPEQLNEISALMNQHAQDCLVTGFEDLIEPLRLPDPDDRHVLAGAIRANASVIVTYNLKDFPEQVLATYEIEAQHPDEFIEHLLDLAPGKIVNAARTHRLSLRNPSFEAQEFLAMLEGFGLVQTVRILREYVASL